MQLEEVVYRELVAAEMMGKTVTCSAIIGTINLVPRTFPDIADEQCP